MITIGLEITSEKAIIEINTHYARLHIKNNRTSFKINQKHAQMQINHKMPTMHIDWTNFRSDIGITPILTWLKQQGENSKSAVLQGIAQISQDGDYLSQISNKGATISALARMHSESKNTVDLNIGAISRPEIKWDLPDTSIKWEPHQISIEWEKGKLVDIQVEPHKVEIRLKKYPKVSIVYKPKQQSNAIGKNVDRYI